MNYMIMIFNWFLTSWAYVKNVSSSSSLHSIKKAVSVINVPFKTL